MLPLIQFGKETAKSLTLYVDARRFLTGRALEVVHEACTRVENFIYQTRQNEIATAHTSVYSRDSRLLLPLKRLLLVDDVMKDVQLVRRQVRQRRAPAASRRRRL